MHRSLNEVTTELRKACLGAGFPVGHSEDLSKAIALLICNGGDGASALIQGLSAGYDNARFGTPHFQTGNINTPFCAAKDGCALFEFLYTNPDRPEIKLTDVDAPKLLIGIGLLFAKTYGCEIEICFNEELAIEIAPGKYDCQGRMGEFIAPSASAKVSLTNRLQETGASSDTKPNADPAPTVSGVCVNEKIWLDIKALSAKTYVPASEASRIKGAGANINDSE